MGKCVKSWVVCSTCKYLKGCETGASRLKSLGQDSLISEDIGCFDYIVYKEDNEAKQLKLF